jgi:hypothetical protein
MRLQFFLWRVKMVTVFQKNKSKKLYLVGAALLAVIIVSILVGCGEKYSEQGHILSREIHNNLISRGICTSKDCNAEYEVYGGHGNQINYSIYNPKDRKVLAALIEFVVENGLQISGGVPISISVYPKSRSEYGNMLFNPKPIVKVEVAK